MAKYLQRASQAKFDDFYTQLADIERELSHYKDHFKNKVVFVIATIRGLAIFSLFFLQL